MKNNKNLTREMRSQPPSSRMQPKLREKRKRRKRSEIRKKRRSCPRKR